MKYVFSICIRWNVSEVITALITMSQQEKYRAKIISIEIHSLVILQDQLYIKLIRSVQNDKHFLRDSSGFCKIIHTID